MNQTAKTDEDEVDFSAEDELLQCAGSIQPWKVLVIDDDQGVHEVTQVVLGNFSFENAGLVLFHAYSGEEGKELLLRHPDAAVMLLDVCMETEHAGLDLVKYIREEIKNFSIRIVLRTGQPGSAPEESVIARYDINDYKEKTELTARKLSTLMFNCLRGFRDLMRLENNKHGLEQIIHSSADLYHYSSLDLLSRGVLEQLDALMNLRGTLLAGSEKGVIAAVVDADKNLNVIAGTGAYSETVGDYIRDVLPEDAIEILNNFLNSPELRRVVAWEDKLLGIFRNTVGEGRVVFISGFKPKTDFDTHLINLYLGSVGDSIENLMLREEIEETQRELVYRLGGAVETRSKETGQHVKRVAEMSFRLALLAGLSSREAALIKCASPMHDVGKIGIPDAILGKPSKLDESEWETMKRHPAIGYDLLKGSQREILSMSAMIALEHHEKWDGSGYPAGKQGGQITLAARITSLVDVFDALGSRRCYKQEWSIEQIIAEIKVQKGRHFDPTLVDLLLDHIDSFVEVRTLFPD